MFQDLYSGKIVGLERLECNMLICVWRSVKSKIPDYTDPAVPNKPMVPILPNMASLESRNLYHNLHEGQQAKKVGNH